MKHLIKYFLLFIGFVSVVLNIYAYPQDKKYSARVSLEYFKIMNEESFILISAKFKGDDGFEQASDLEFSVYEVHKDDSLTYLDKVKTNDMGQAKFIIKDNLGEKLTDTLSIYTYMAVIDNNEKFKDTKKSISFSRANLSANLAMVDSTYQITAILSDTSGEPIEGEFLRVDLKRFYGLLRIGEDRYETNEKGLITVPIDESMPGVEGNLSFEVTLKESDVYGTIKAFMDAPIGVSIEDESSFDKRTLWSPPDKTPFYLLIFPNLIILGVWIPLLFLTFNLYRISKNKVDKL